MERIDRRKLGEILIEDELITKAQLQEALDIQKKMEERRPLGELLVELGYLPEEGLCLSLSKKLGLKYVSFSDKTLDIKFDQDVDKLISEDFAITHMVLPLSKTPVSLTIAVWDPLDFVVLDNIKKLTRLNLIVYCSTRKDIKEGIEKLYLRKGLKETRFKEFSVDEKIPKDMTPRKSEIDELKLKAAEVSVVRLVNNLIREGIKERASDIHLEPQENDVAVRYRIDGALHEAEHLSKDTAPAVISRIKILSRLDIAEKRLPQDGGFMTKVGDKSIDIRVSTIPTIYGEKLAMRLLDKESMHFDLSSIGLSKADHKKVEENITKPNGLVFLTGPTGSGKTTTLYCILNEIKSSRKNIITIEDPVEYRIEGINQVQAQPQIGLDFARGLRSFLRQDPDVIMVGEVRDLETAEICVRSALVGRLVLSTLHTNDSVGAISRLLDFGIEPFLLSSGLNMVIAQRLVRKLCPECKQPIKLEADIAAKYELKGVKVYGPNPKGCKSCGGYGFSGRIAIFEVMCADTEIKNMIERKEDIAAIREALIKKGMRPLREDSIDKVKEGITSLDEVIAATMETK